MDFTEKLCEALGCMPTRADAVQLLRRVIGHFKEGKLLPFIHKDNLSLGLESYLWVWDADSIQGQLKGGDFCTVVN